MRTTLTLDPDIAQQIERLRQSSGRSLKQVVNDLLREGLARRLDDRPGDAIATPTKPVSCGGFLLPVTDLDSTGAVLARLDEEDAGVEAADPS